jgi:hypothetical protein
MMLESSVLLKEIMKIPDNSAALLVVPPVVEGRLSNFQERGVSFISTSISSFPAFFLITSLSHDEQLT